MAFQPSSFWHTLGTMLQALGMLAMFGAFIYLVLSIQGLVGNVTGSMSVEGGLTQGSPQAVPDVDAMQSQMTVKVYEFIAMLGVGIGIMFLGLILKAGGGSGGKGNNRVVSGRYRYGVFGGRGGT